MYNKKIELTDIEKNYILSWAKENREYLELNPQDLPKIDYDNSLQIIENIINWCDYKNYPEK